jgi:hypothetical protein
MAHVGCPEENGYAERLIRTIKEEEVALSDYRDFADARRQLGAFLDGVDNGKRIHSALGYVTPAEFADRWHSEQTSTRTTPTPTTASLTSRQNWSSFWMVWDRRGIQKTGNGIAVIRPSNLAGETE